MQFKYFVLFLGEASVVQFKEDLRLKSKNDHMSA